VPNDRVELLIVLRAPGRIFPPHCCNYPINAGAISLWLSLVSFQDAVMRPRIAPPQCHRWPSRVRRLLGHL
jgi:hypothetical protein